MFWKFKTHVQIQDGVQNGHHFYEVDIGNALFADGFVEVVCDSFKVNALAGHDRGKMVHVFCNYKSSYYNHQVCSHMKSCWAGCK